MDKTPWVPALDRDSKTARCWRVARHGAFAENVLGKTRTFATRDNAERAAEKLNDAEGIFVSGFKDVPGPDAKLVRERLLAGDTLSEVRSHFRTDGRLTYSMSRMRRMRNEVFAPLSTDPSKLKELANGVLLNPAAIVRYRHPREEVAAGVAQIEMFSA